MGDPDADARRYHRRQLAVSATDLGVTVGVLTAWLGTGAATALAAALTRGLGTPMAVVAGMAAAVGASAAALTFPLDLVGGFVLPRRAGLLTQSFLGWLADRAKGLAVGGALGLVAVEVVYALLRWSPAWWWLWSAAALAAGAILLTAIVPVWLAPLFYRLTPLADPALGARLLALAARMGVAATEVAVADLSRKGRTANAAVVGLARTRRIVVSDTLLASFPADEVLVVLAHELAHHARRHVAQGLALQGLTLLAALALAHRVLAVGARALDLAGPADPAGLPFLALILAGAGLLATPLVAAWSRRLEREADAVAIAVTRRPEAFVSAMERLARLNLAERRPNRLKELLFATHPSIEQRIALGRAAAHSA